MAVKLLTNLKTYINDFIKANGVKAITGPISNKAHTDTIDTLYDISRMRWFSDLATFKAYTSHNADQNGGVNSSIYSFDETSVLTGDDITVIRPDDILTSEPGRWLRIYQFNSYSYFDATVGVGGDYPNLNGISLALADGHRHLKIISDITETSIWGSSGDSFHITSENEYTITLNGTVDTTANIYITNATFEVLGTTYAFKNAKLFLYGECKINGGDSNYNMFSDNITYPNIIQAERLLIDGGTGSIRVAISSVNYLNIKNGNGSDGIGLYKYLDNPTTVDELIMDSISAFNMFDYSTVNKGSGGNINLRGTRATIRNMTDLNVLIRANDGRIYSCQINTLRGYTDLNELAIIRDSSINNMPSYLGSVLNKLYIESYGICDNVVFNNGDVIINSDNITISNCKVTAGTFNVGSLALNTVITAPRTLTSITGTLSNAQIIAPNLI